MVLHVVTEHAFYIGSSVSCALFYAVGDLGRIKERGRCSVKRILTYACICAVLICCGLGCTAQETETLSQPDIDEEVTLVLTGGWVDSVAIESIAHEFHTKYPACTIVYEYLQNYEESLLTRLEDGTGSIDIFLTNNLQEGSKLQPYALELFSQSDALDLSNIHDGLIKNFTYQNSDKDAPPEIYAVPVGAEMRGMFVNKTLLASLNIDVPANLEEFLAACEALKENGYVPIQANPSFAGQPVYLQPDRKCRAI